MDRNKIAKRFIAKLLINVSQVATFAVCAKTSKEDTGKRIGTGGQTEINEDGTKNKWQYFE